MKKKSCRSWNGLLPNSQAWSRYSRLYRDIAGHRHAGACMASQDTTTTRPSTPAIWLDEAYDTSGLLAGSTVARAHMVWPGVGRDTKICIVDEGGDFGSRYNAPALRYDSMCAQHGAAT